MKIYEVQNRHTQLLETLLKIWEDSVRVTHLFLSDSEVKRIKKYVPQALSNAEHLIVAENEDNKPVAFMETEKSRLEMLFLEKNTVKLKDIQKMAYVFAVILAIFVCAIMFILRTNIGSLFGSSVEVNHEIAKIMPIFLVSVPFVAITRIAAASFYSTKVYFHTF